MGAFVVTSFFGSFIENRSEDFWNFITEPSREIRVESVTADNVPFMVSGKVARTTAIPEQKYTNSNYVQTKLRLTSDKKIL